VDWKLTATKLFCESAEKWVTIIVYSNGSTKCGYYQRHLAKGGGGSKGNCHFQGTCQLMEEYREDVFQRADVKIVENKN